MQELQVGAIVNSIRTAFDGGFDMLRQMEATKHNKRPKKASTSPASSRAFESLSRGSEMIQACYDHNSARHGRSFVIGDVLAQTQLARILLDLNTGILALFNMMSAKDSKNRTLIKQSLLSLSDNATNNTMEVLESLHERLSKRSILDTHPKTKLRVSETPPSKVKDDLKSHNSTKNSTDAIEANPLLTRGGWVRTKSGNLITVSAADARRRAARKSDKKRTAPENRSTLVSSKVEKQTDKKLISEVPVQELPPHRCHCQNTELVPTAENILTRQALYVPSNVSQRPPSLYIVPSDFFHGVGVVGSLPPTRPPKIPLHTRPNPNMKPRPFSGSTFLTASTKIGEIPENRLPDRMMSEEEKISRPLPYTIPPPLFEAPKRRKKGFWLFRRAGMTVP